jgi:hypothetical protein
MHGDVRRVNGRAGRTRRRAAGGCSPARPQRTPRPRPRRCATGPLSHVSLCHAAACSWLGHLRPRDGYAHGGPSEQVVPASMRAGPAAWACGLPARVLRRQAGRPVTPQPCWQLQNSRQPILLLARPCLTPKCPKERIPCRARHAGPRAACGALCAAILLCSSLPGAHLVPASVGSRPSALTSTAPDPAGGLVHSTPISSFGGQHRGALRRSWAGDRASEPRLKRSVCRLNGPHACALSSVRSEWRRVDAGSTTDRQRCRRGQGRAAVERRGARA